MRGDDKRSIRRSRTTRRKTTTPSSCGVGTSAADSSPSSPFVVFVATDSTPPSPAETRAAKADAAGGGGGAGILEPASSSTSWDASVDPFVVIVVVVFVGRVASSFGASATVAAGRGAIFASASASASSSTGAASVLDFFGAGASSSSLRCCADAVSFSVGASPSVVFVAVDSDIPPARRADLRGDVRLVSSTSASFLVDATSFVVVVERLGLVTTAAAALLALVGLAFALVGLARRARVDVRLVVVAAAAVVSSPSSLRVVDRRDDDHRDGAAAFASSPSSSFEADDLREDDLLVGAMSYYRRATLPARSPAKPTSGLPATGSPTSRTTRAAAGVRARLLAFGRSVTRAQQLCRRSN